MFANVRSFAVTAVPTASTTWNINMPTAVESTDDILVIVSPFDNSGSPSVARSGWTLRHSDSVFTPPRTLRWLTKDAVTGSEDGTQEAFTIGASSNGCAIALAVISADDPANWVWATLATGLGNNSPNPPSLNSGLGAVDVLWLAVALAVDDDETFTAFPADYTHVQAQVQQGSGVDNSQEMGLAGRLLNAASEDPGTFTLSDVENWLAQTVAIGPAAAVTGTGTVTAPASEVSGAGTVAVTGSGSLSPGAGMLDGAGSVVVTGDGALSARAGIVAGGVAVGDVTDRFDAYSDAAATGVVKLVWQIDLVGADGETLATSDPSEAGGNALLWSPQLGPIDFKSDAASQRTASLTVPVADKTLIGLLHPESGNRVVAYAGIDTGDEVLLWPQGTFLPETIDAVSVAGLVELSVELVDLTRPARSTLVSTVTFDEDDTVESVIDRLLGEVLPGEAFTVAATGFTVPGGSFDVGSDRWQLLTELVESCGHEIIADRSGIVRSRPVPLSSGSPTARRWQYGPSGIPVSNVKRSWRVRQPGGWKVEGGSFRTSDTAVTVVVYDTDPSSEGYFTGPGEVEVPTSRLPFVRTVPQAVQAGYAQLRRQGAGPGVVEFDTLPNPSLREQDLIELDCEELDASGEYMVLDSQLPVHVDGAMRIKARRTYNPAVGFVPPLGRGEGCLVSFNDSFERADQNLEDLVGSSGSVDWTEIGFSWGVVDGQAVQRFYGGYSMALVNTPLCSRDHSAEIDIVSTLAGRIGPVVRSSGGSDGYAALVGSSGDIYLEMWLNGAHVETLGVFETGGSMDGKTLRLEAEGDEIRMLVGSEVVLTATDDRRTGQHVGMLGQGGTTQTGPRAESFDGGQL